MPNHERFMMRYDLSMDAGGEEAEIMIYDEIVSRKWNDDDPEVTALEFDKLLKKARENGATRLRLRINSPGGSVYQAIAMRAMLMNSGFAEISIAIGWIRSSWCLPRFRNDFAASIIRDTLTHGERVSAGHRPAAHRAEWSAGVYPMLHSHARALSVAASAWAARKALQVSFLFQLLSWDDQ